MRRSNSLRSVIFDLDGTLIDSMKIWYRIDREFLLENGVTDPPADISERLKKMTVEDSAELLKKEFSLSQTAGQIVSRIGELVRFEYENRIPLKPDAAQLLDYLEQRGVGMCVATATYKELAEAALKRLNIRERFSFVYTDRDFPCGKSHPDIFLAAAKRLGTAPEETLVIEDSLHSIETASSAGFVTAGIYEETAAAEQEAISSAADYYFKELEEVQSLFP